MNIDKKISVYNGRKLQISIFGGSHDAEIGVIVKGFDNEIIDREKLKKFMDRRRAKNKSYSTKRFETDEVVFADGVTRDKVTGTMKAVIKNNDQHSGDYKNVEKVPRPSHADFVAFSKYGDNYDYRGGGKFSGRLTAPMCIAGGIAKNSLEKKGIKINAYISSIGKIKGKSYKDMDPLFSVESLNEEFPLLDDSKREEMEEEIKNSALSLDSVGGTIECVVENVPVGTGEYMFDSIESIISHLMFAVPAVKGIEFGTGFNISALHGSEANDEFYYDENGEVKTKTNNNGGINGGLANGMNITFRVAIKPTPSISQEQNTINMTTKENVKLKIVGRHDSCIVVRAVPVIEAMASLAIYDCME